MDQLYGIVVYVGFIIGTGAVFYIIYGYKQEGF